jgi:hypothetical protein
MTEPESYDSGEEFDYEGKYEGKVYTTRSTNSNSKKFPCIHALFTSLPTTQVLTSTPRLPAAASPCHPSMSEALI